MPLISPSDRRRETQTLSHLCVILAGVLYYTVHSSTRTDTDMHAHTNHSDHYSAVLMNSPSSAASLGRRWNQSNSQGGQSATLTLCFGFFMYLHIWYLSSFSIHQLEKALCRGRSWLLDFPKHYVYLTLTGVNRNQQNFVLYGVFWEMTGIVTVTAKVTTSIEHKIVP